MFCTWLVTVKLSSFSGRRRSFFSTIRPIEIRPMTGGVKAKPLSIKISLLNEKHTHQQKRTSPLPMKPASCVMNKVAAYVCTRNLRLPGLGTM